MNEAQEQMVAVSTMCARCSQAHKQLYRTDLVQLFY